MIQPITDTTMNKLMKPGLLLLMMALILWGCKDPWEDHLKPDGAIPESNLFELLQSTPELSYFTGYLIDAGWQEELESSKSFTVWAPDNDAMSAMDAWDLDDSASLAMFVNNHIGFTAYPYYSPVKQVTVKMFSDKNLLIDNENGKIEDASLLEPFDRLATNGILHVIDKALLPKPNAWEIIEITGSAPQHVAYLKSLSEMVFNPSIATIIGVDPVTGKPVYDTLSGMVWSNRLITEVRDLRKEDSLSTVILVEDPVWESEFLKYRPYYKLADSVKSDELTRWLVSRDLVFRGLKSLEEMPDTLVSLFGIKIPFDRSAIQQTYEASNGIVYVMNNCDVRLGDKIHPFIVEGEDTNRVTFIAVSGQTGYTRQVELASGGYDFILDNHGANPGNIKYHMGEFAAGYYDFYWVAVNDFRGSYRTPNSATVLQQRLDFVRYLGMAGHEIIWSTPSQISDLITVVDSTYETAREVYLGQRFFTTYQDVWLQVTGSGRNTTICLDYLKAVPVLEEE
jgi:uncharacterized surface protein with fasciclin (FAS1) repeats